MLFKVIDECNICLYLNSNTPCNRGRHIDNVHADRTVVSQVRHIFLYLQQQGNPMYIGHIRHGAYVIAYALSHFFNKLQAKRVNESSTIFFKTQCNEIWNDQTKDSRLNKEQLKKQFMVHGSFLDLKLLRNNGQLCICIKWALIHAYLNTSASIEQRKSIST